MQVHFLLMALATGGFSEAIDTNTNLLQEANMIDGIYDLIASAINQGNLRVNFSGPKVFEFFL